MDSAAAAAILNQCNLFTPTRCIEPCITLRSLGWLRKCVEGERHFSYAGWVALYEEI